MHAQLEGEEINLALNCCLINSGIVNCTERIISHEGTRAAGTAGSELWSLTEGTQLCASWH